MELKPIRDKVFLIKKETKEVTDFGFEIIKPLHGGDSGTLATVKAVGPDCKHVKPGDEVYVYWRKGQDIVLEDNDQGMIVYEKEISVVLNSEE